MEENTRNSVARSAKDAAVHAMRLGVRDWWRTALTLDTAGDVTFAMTGPTGYVVAGNGVLWGMDLCLRYDWTRDLILSERELFSRLRFVVYTHSHEDHLDPRVLDLLAAHLWLGDHNAEKLPCSPYAELFAEFVAALSPRRAAITHLYKSGRQILSGRFRTPA